MIIDLKAKDKAKLRRLALAHQGLTQRSPFGRGRSAALKAMEHIGYVQIDTISVVERAHHHVLANRVENYTPTMLANLIDRREAFEYWSHAAAFLPMSHYRYYLPFKQMIKAGKVHWFKQRDQKLMSRLLDQIRAEGALRSRDLEDHRPSKAGWWDWKPAKRALEQLYFQGDLMVSSREGFEKAYDLPERIIPDHVDQSLPTYAEMADFVLDQQLTCHGLVTLKGITYQRRDADLRQAVKQAVNARVAADQLTAIRVDGGSDVWYARPETLDQAKPRVPKEARLLSPFDNALIQRERVQSLFDFDYQIECYVPEPKRKFGYFCLPVLDVDQIIGRADCKAHRDKRRFEVIYLCLDDQVELDADRIERVAAAIARFARFNDCDDVLLTKTEPGRIKGGLQSAVDRKMEIQDVGV